MPSRSLLGQLTDGPLVKTCDADWNEMEGTDKVRHCLSCQRDVFFVSAMSPAEAELRLLNAGDAVPCIRYARDAAGSVVHAPEAERYQRLRPLRSLVVASALGVALAPEPARAAPKPGSAKGAPNQCVVLTQPTATSAPASPFAGAAPSRPPQPAPAPAPPAAAPPAARPSAPAPSQPAPPAPAPPPPPIPLGGVPPPPKEQVHFGTLILKSKVARKVTIASIALEAPLPSYNLTPGPFVMEVQDPTGKRRKVRFTIHRDATTTVDLDKR